jgi:hypothetical protein
MAAADDTEGFPNELEEREIEFRDLILLVW